MNASNARLARAYVRAESRALRRFTATLRPGARDRELELWTGAERIADALAARIATARAVQDGATVAARYRPSVIARYYARESTAAHRGARLALGLEC